MVVGVWYLKFVETQNGRFSGKISSHRYYWVTTIESHSDFSRVNTFVDIDHESVEMDPSFTL